MSIRFRYRDRDGKEVAVPGLDELRIEIREGRVRDSTPLFDADTGIFAPASDHDPYRLLAEIVANGGGGPADLLPMRMTLTDVPDVDPTEALEELRRELAREAEAQGETLRVDRYNPTLREWDDGPSGTAPAPGPAPAPGGPEVELPTFVRAAPRARPAPSGPHRRNASRGLRRLAGTAAAAVVALTLAAGLWAVMSDGALSRTADALPMPSFDAGAERDRAPSVTRAAAGGVDGPAGEDRPVDPAARDARGGQGAVASPGAVPLAASEGAAFEHMVQGIDSLARLFAVGEPPAAWLEGRYLADAGAYPEVASYWERYLAFADAVQAESELLFRRGFVRELEQQGVSGPVVSMRVADALPRFREEARVREQVFQRMTALGRKALTLHDLLVLRSDDLTYDPMAGSAVTGDAFLQVAVEDDDLRESMWRMMDGIFAELEALHGEGRWSRDDLARGMVRGGLTR